MNEDMYSKMENMAEIFEMLKVTNAAMMQKMIAIDERQQYLTSRNDILIEEVINEKHEIGRIEDKLQGQIDAMSKTKKSKDKGANETGAKKSTKQKRGPNYMSDDVSREVLQNAITDLQRKVGKAIKLEETVLKQEDVILKMETLLKKYQLKEALERKAELMTSQGLNPNEEVLASLTKQNNRLQLDVLRMKDAMEAEKLELKLKMERAESRRSMLEHELVKYAHEWAKERNKIIQKITDAEAAADN